MALLKANVLVANAVAGDAALALALARVAAPELRVGADSLLAMPVKVYVLALLKFALPSYGLETVRSSALGLTVKSLAVPALNVVPDKVKLGVSVRE